MADGVAPPSGTVTFLFTDVEGSTPLWDRHADGMAAALERHDAILRAAVESHDGYVFTTAGDSFAAAFSRVLDGLGAAVAAQRALGAEAWPGQIPIRVRMGLHVGEAYERDGDFFGSAVNTAARIMSLAHGGQILVSGVVADLASGTDDVGFADLGQVVLRGQASPVPVRQVLAAGLEASFPALRGEPSARTNIDSSSGELVGRADDVGRVLAALRSHRAVTLVGPGGMGKTRLARQVALEVADHYRDGAWFVELAPLGSGEGVGVACAAALGVRPAGEQTFTDAVGAYVRSRELLLVLDNCEHVIDDAADMVAGLLSAARGLGVLATSREPLRIGGEALVELGGLDIDAGVELYRRRCQQAGAPDGDAESIRMLISRLDAMPLAIELAAARARTMSPRELLARVDESWATLATRQRDVPQRHRTLRSTVAWSYDLLDEPLRDGFDRLAVLAGTFDAPAAAAVTGAGAGAGAGEDAHELLDELVERSMLTSERSGEITRFRLLETLRQFGHRRLVERNELDPVRRRHLEFYIARARDIAALREAGGEVDWNRVGRLDTDNLRAAFNYALSAGDVHRAVDLFYELHRFAVFQLQVGLFEWADQLADLHATHPEICTARYQVAMCRFQWQRGRLHDALRSAELASDLDDGQDPQLSADRAEAAFAPHWFLGDSHAAYQTAQAGIDCAVAANLTASHCRLLAMRAQAEMSLGDPNAEATVRHSLAIANIAGSELLRTTGLLTLGGLLVGRAPAEAARHLEELRDIADRHGELWHLHSAQRVHGVALTRLGQHAEAAAAFRASIDGFERSGQSSHVWLVISNVCQLLVQAGQQHEAAVLLAAYELQPDLPTEASTMRGQQRARQALAGALTDSQLGDAHRRAQQLDPDGVIAYAKSTLTFLTDNARATTG